MDYDINGPWSPHIAPNAPLYDLCSSMQTGSVMSSVEAWIKAGFRPEQLIVGVAGYGHSFHVTPSGAITPNGMINLTATFDKSQQPSGDKWDSTAGGVDECGNPNVVGGVFNFWGLITAGFLTEKGTAAEGIYYTFDPCSKTVRVINSPKNYWADSLMILSI
jgi:chitinase